MEQKNNEILRIAHNIINSIGVIISIFLIARFLFLLLGANAGHPVSSFIYNVSGLFVAPLKGIFPQFTIQEGPYVFEPATILAIALVLVIIYIIGLILAMIDTELAKDEK